MICLLSKQAVLVVLHLLTAFWGVGVLVVLLRKHRYRSDIIQTPMDSKRNEGLNADVLWAGCTRITLLVAHVGWYKFYAAAVGIAKTSKTSKKRLWEEIKFH